MSAAEHLPKERFQRVTHRRRCAICGKPDWCVYDPAAGIAICCRVQSDTPDHRFSGWVHQVTATPDEIDERAAINLGEPYRGVSDEEANSRDELYREMVRLCPLSPVDRAELERRGLGDDVTLGERFFTYPPDGPARIRLMRDLEQYAAAHDLTFALWRLPGVKCSAPIGGGLGWQNQLAGRQRGGLAIMVPDVAGRIIAVQIRARDADRQAGESRYTWLSVPGVTPSYAPAYLARPLQPLRDRSRVIVTEGAFKALAAAHAWGCLAIAVPGISIQAGVLPMLDALRQGGDVAPTARILVAFDEEPDKSQVTKWRDTLVARIAAADWQQVGLLRWDGSRAAKLDDALAAHLPMREEMLAQQTWEEPRPLASDLPEVAPLDMHMLPAGLRAFVWDIHERMQVPVDFPAITALIAAGAVIGRRIGIRPKKYDDWTVTPTFWGGLVGPSGWLKSPSMAEAMKPLERLIIEANKQYEAEKLTYEAEKLTYELAKAALMDRMKTAARAAGKPPNPDKPAPQVESIDDLKRQLAELRPPAEPTKRRYRTNDTTVEKLGELLIANPAGLLIYRDELMGWIRTMDKQGHEADRAFYLECWGGTSRNHEQDRIGRGSSSVPALCVSVLGGIQPGRLRSYVYAASDNDNADADGFLQRFQLLVWPDVRTQFTRVDRWPNKEAKAAAYAMFERLANLTPADYGAVSDDEFDPCAIPTLRFDDEAQEIFYEWWEELEARVRSGDLPEAFTSHLAKYRSLMPGLALLFHLIDANPAEPGFVGSVGTEAALTAIAWCEYLETHARRVYASATNPSMERASTLLKHIKRGEVSEGCTIRDIYLRHGWEHLQTPDDVEDALRTLEGYGWVRVEEPKAGPKGGRPTKIVHLHPSVRTAKPTGGTDDDDD